MVRDLDDSYLSELEHELELEMDDLEFEHGSELDDEIGDEEFESEYEEDLQQEFEMSDAETGDYAERFYELSQTEFESESELDRELDGLLNEMERDYFFGGVKKFLKNKGKGLLKKGLKFAAGKIPALQALKGITQLARGNLKGSLLALAKTAMASHPAGAAALPALKALGFEAEANDPEANREAWDNYVEVAREAYAHLAENLNETADSPLEASRLATNAFQNALQKRSRSGARRATSARRRSFSSGGSERKRQIVYIDRDVEEVIIRRR